MNACTQYRREREGERIGAHSTRIEWVDLVYVVCGCIGIFGFHSSHSSRPSMVSHPLSILQHFIFALAIAS